ncbi:protein-tyrosine phosphatase family protein [Legionella jordanis]|nr:dual specificity protein phosphatase family protein [Legionella jordanis]RMX02554.1 protein phosphatase [Legionella jordanis]RMX21783.1 protein phosphatase [Legionella jordanis]HAT8713753.1 protein phosphatase [Legionella jordanis]
MIASTLNFNWVEGNLAVGGRFPMEAAEELAQKEGIRAIVDLRMEASDNEDILQRHGISFLRLPTEDRCAIAAPMINDGVEWVRNRLHAGTKVLIHCEHGIGRSALLALCTLVSEGIEPLDAMERLKKARPVVSPAPEQLEAFRGWIEHWPYAKTAFKVPSFEALSYIAYAHLRAS